MLPRGQSAARQSSQQADRGVHRAGHVVVVGGSHGLMGAPAMASLAALRAAWEAADLPGRAGTPAAFVDGKAIEVFTEVDDVVEVVGAEEFEGLVKAALA